MSSLERVLKYSARIGIISEFHPILFYVNAILFPSANGLRYVLSFTDKFVKQRLDKPQLEQDSTGPVDFITNFLQMQQENPEKMKIKDIMNASLANIGAGSDTTGVSLTAALYHLSQNPEALAKLRSELHQARLSGSLSHPATFKETQRLPYLQAVIKEALRVHPAAGLPLSRVVPAGGCEIAGRYFPAGVRVVLILALTVLTVL